MASGTPKDERKRKRAAEAQEAAVKTSKKVKRDRLSSGGVEYGTVEGVTPLEQDGQATLAKKQKKERQTEDNAITTPSDKTPKQSKKKTKKAKDNLTNGDVHEEQEKESSLQNGIENTKRSASSHTLVKAARGTSESSPWNASSSIGGRFIDHDPVFSADEKYVVSLINH